MLADAVAAGAATGEAVGPSEHASASVAAGPAWAHPMAVSAAHGALCAVLAGFPMRCDALLAVLAGAGAYRDCAEFGRTPCDRYLKLDHEPKLPEMVGPD